MDAAKEMKNVTVSQAGTALTITVDLLKTFGLSGSGKSLIIASSVGNKVVATDTKDGKDIVIGLNVYKKA